MKKKKTRSIESLRNAATVCENLANKTSYPKLKKKYESRARELHNEIRMRQT